MSKITRKSFGGFRDNRVWCLPLHPAASRVVNGGKHGIRNQLNYAIIPASISPFFAAAPWAFVIRPYRRPYLEIWCGGPLVGSAAFGGQT
jgi:hypothetical protein